MPKYKLNGHACVRPNCSHLKKSSAINYAPLPRHAGEWWNYPEVDIINILKIIGGIENIEKVEIPLSGKKGQGHYIIRLVEKVIELSQPHD